uniref:Uncharacterized protein n=1 Tax=Dulem virus 40 TaxID=3145758 RepID=A0AAU8AX48_9CAUD
MCGKYSYFLLYGKLFYRKQCKIAYFYLMFPRKGGSRQPISKTISKENSKKTILKAQSPNPPRPPRKSTLHANV